MEIVHGRVRERRTDRVELVCLIYRRLVIACWDALVAMNALRLLWSLFHFPQQRDSLVEEVVLEKVSAAFSTRPLGRFCSFVTVSVVDSLLPSLAGVKLDGLLGLGSSVCVAGSAVSKLDDRHICLVDSAASRALLVAASVCLPLVTDLCLSSAGPDYGPCTLEAESV